MGNELAVRNGSELAETMELGQVLARSGFFQDSRDAAQAVVKVLAGRELGFGPVASMTGVYIVKGKVSLSANLMAAAVKRSGRYNYRVKTLTDKTCTIAFIENGEVIGDSTFTEQDAKTAGLLSNTTWKNYPRNMLFARAMSNGVRWYCPDIMGGPIYTPDELGAEVDGETGEIIEAPARVVQPEPVPEPEPEPDQPEQSRPDSTMQKRFHAIGHELYGSDWDAKRAELVHAVTGNGNSSKDLSVAQMTKLITGMDKRLAEARREPLDAINKMLVEQAIKGDDLTDMIRVVTGKDKELTDCKLPQLLEILDRLEKMVWGSAEDVPFDEPEAQPA